MTSCGSARSPFGRLRDLFLAFRQKQGNNAWRRDLGLSCTASAAKDEFA